MTDTTEATALLAELAKTPKDQHLLSVYADALEEAGSTELAQFVRLEARMRAAMPPATDEIKALGKQIVALGNTLIERHATWFEQFNIPNVRGTSWEGFTQFPNKTPSTFIARFLANGRLNYTQDGRSHESGTWVQTGSVVMFEMNRHYADYTSLIIDGKIHGTATNIKNAKWIFHFTLMDGPTVTPEDTDRTIYPWTERERARPKRTKKAVAKKPAGKNKPIAKPPAAKKPATKPSKRTAKKPATKPAKKPAGKTPAKKPATKTKPAAKKPAAKKKPARK